MKKVVALFYGDPVVALAAVVGVLQVLATADVIIDWIPLAALAAAAPFQRALVTPARDKLGRRRSR